MILRLGGKDVDLVQQLLTVDQRVGLLGGFVVDVDIRLRSRIGVFHIFQVSDGQSAIFSRFRTIYTIIVQRYTMYRIRYRPECY